MSAPKKPAAKGQITYHVGWKKGMISKKSATPDLMPLNRQDKALRGYIWRQAAFVPASLDLFLICALPVISFIAFITLVYLLYHS